LLIAKARVNLPLRRSRPTKKPDGIVDPASPGGNKMIRLSRRAVLGAALASPFLSRAVVAQAAEIRVMSSGSFTAAYERLGPVFEQRTGHKLISTFGASFGPDPTSLPERLNRGEPADVLIALADGLTALAKSGHVEERQTPLAESRLAFAVKTGTPVPDMSTVDAMRRALLAAGSVAYSPSGSGLYYERELVQRLGIADQMLPKSRRVLRERIGAVVARGDAEMGLQQISELLPIQGIQIIRIPEEVQRVSIAAGAVAMKARHPEAARQLLAFLTSADAAGPIVATGLDPIKR
jgi:molybdate transport system substrate-binding protein